MTHHRLSHLSPLFGIGLGFGLGIGLTACGDASVEPAAASDASEALRAEPLTDGPLRAADTFQIRGETKLGCRNRGLMDRSWTSERECAELSDHPDEFIDALTNFDRYLRLHGDSDGFVRLPRMRSKFQIDPGPDRLVAITLSAMGMVSEQTPGQHTRARVLIDGQVVAEPGPIDLFSGRQQPNRWGPRAFTFLTEASPGMHVVEVQYDSDALNVWLRDVSLRIDIERMVESETPGLPPEAEGLYGDTVVVDDSFVLGSAWTAMPGGGLDFSKSQSGELMLTLSPVFEAEGDDLWIRPVIDGGAAASFPAVYSFDADEESSPHSINFTGPAIPFGDHHVDWEWRSAGQTQIQLSSLSEVALTVPHEDPDYFIHTRQQIQELTLTWEDNFEVDDEGWHPIMGWQPLAGLTTEFELDEISDASITFTTEISGDRIVFIAPTVNGQVLRDQEVLAFAQAHDNEGARSYTFAVKDIPPGVDGASTELGLVARNADGHPEGEVVLHSSNAVFQVKRRVGPDLAVGAKVGAGSRVYDAIVEPVAGETPVLAIVFDAQRDDATVPEAAVANFEAAMDDMLYGSDPSVDNYLSAMSGGLVTIAPAEQTRLYFGDEGGGLVDVNYYWDNSQHDCENGDTFTSAASARFSAALRAAEDDGFPFPTYDRNRDGVLEAHELTIIIFSLHGEGQGTNGSSMVPRFRPYCESGARFLIDDVEINEFAQVNLPMSPNFFAKDPLIISTTMHELGHAILRLDDVYERACGTFDPVTGQYTPSQTCDPSVDEVRERNPNPKYVALMASSSNNYPHLAGFHKLHLGWVNPRIPADSASYLLTDIATSEELLVLPRRFTDAREFFTFSSRFATDDELDPKYDHFIPDEGLAVFHIIEPSSDCFVDTPDPELCLPRQPPACMPEYMWSGVSNYVRAGMRLVQPDLTHSGENNLLFSSAEGSILDQDPGGGLTCPTPQQIGEVGGVGHLTWVDHEPSGYTVQAIVDDAVAGTVNFDLSVP